MKPVPTTLLAHAMHELNLVVTELVDHKQSLTDAEFKFLSWYARFHILMRPYVGVIPLPPPKEKRE